MKLYDDLLQQISWKDAYYRTDIAWRAIAREQQQ